MEVASVLKLVLELSIEEVDMQETDLHLSGK